MTFKELGLSDDILKSLTNIGHNIPTAIQELAIPHILQGKDILGCAQTGTGKTAAFVLPIIEHLIKKERVSFPKPKVLILSPTRELAVQTRDNFRKYGSHTELKCGVILGGVNQRSQEEVIRKGLDVIVATPGRLLDLVNQRVVKLNTIEILVLDEADTMLDMGFIHDIRKIVSLVPETRQTLMFSATMPTSIKNLANEFLKEPILVEANTSSTTVDTIEQSLYYVEKKDKAKLLIDILNSEESKSTLVFTRTKHGANRLAETLEKSNFYSEVIHGNKRQSARTKALNNFKTGKSKVLIATDVAARGIDIVELFQVINYELPETPESYIHRIGRTGRAGCNGKAITLCDVTEKRRLNEIEKLIKQSLSVIENHNYPVTPKNKEKKKDNIKNTKVNNNNSANDNKDELKNSNYSSENKNKDSRNNNYKSNNSRNESKKNYWSKNNKNESRNSNYSSENKNKDSRNNNYESNNNRTETKKNYWSKNNKNESRNSNYSSENKNKDSRNNNYESNKNRTETKNNYWSKNNKNELKNSNYSSNNNKKDSRNSNYKFNNNRNESKTRYSHKKASYSK